MNLLFFLTPKSQVAYVHNDHTLRNVLEKMEFHRYSSIPILEKNGKYYGTIAEGDLLWSIKNDYQMNIRQAENIKLGTIKRNRDYQKVNVEVEIEDLMDLAMKQNFVPVVDDNDIFIGIVTRKRIIEHCLTMMDLHKKEHRMKIPRTL